MPKSRKSALNSLRLNLSLIMPDAIVFPPFITSSDEFGLDTFPIDSYAPNSGAPL